MLNDVTSRHLRNANDLLVLAPIKQGFVPVRDTISYATRLRVLLRSFYEGRRLLAESTLAWSAGPTEKLQTILNTQYAVLPNNRHLLVTVTFDRNWEEYFRFLVLHSGPSLDAIFMHCEGYADYACRRYNDTEGKNVTFQYQAFSDFVHRYQIPTDFYYAAFPDLTADDIVYLRKLASQRSPSSNRTAGVKISDAEAEIAAMQVETARTKHPELKHLNAHAVQAFLQPQRKESVLKSLAGLWDLRKLFPPEVEPDEKSQTPLAKASDYFDEAIINIVPDLLGVTTTRPCDPIESWIEQLKNRAARTTLPPSAQSDPDFSDIQANILGRGVKKVRTACAVLLRWDTPEVAAEFLNYVSSKLTTHDRGEREGSTLNFYITFPGCTRLGLPDDVLAQFPKDFRDGMAQRCGAIGDVGEPNHPDYWQPPCANWQDGKLKARGSERISLAAVDCVVLLQTTKEGVSGSDPLHQEVAKLEAIAGVRILHVRQLQRDASRREHFGFLDGGAQPVPNIPSLASRQGVLDRDLTPLGEFLLGYGDARGEVAWCADPKRNQHSYPLFKNGSFLVMRKLDQDVPAFNKFAEKRAKYLEIDPKVFKSWMVGRDLSGNALVGSASDNPHDFDYDNDATGRQCPLHAHIRRANPRTLGAASGAPPRIMRCGFSYGPHLPDGATENDGQERGLLFMAHNASLSQQFEIVQRWLNGGNSTGILSAQNDLLTGVPMPATAPHWAHQGQQWVDMQSPITPFVSLRWGFYLFAPSKSALDWLIQAIKRPTAARPDMDLVRRGEEIIAQLQAVAAQQGAGAARVAWKSVIEEILNEPLSAAVWAAIRARRDGMLLTPYGLLVATEAGAKDVLAGDGRLFSVREYWHRLQATTGEHYLSFDPEPRSLPSSVPENQVEHERYEARMAQAGGRYAAAASLPNEFIEAHLNHEERAFNLAFSVAKDALDQWATREVPIQELATVVVAQLSQRWFDLPDVATEPPRACPHAREQLDKAIDPYVLASRFSFQPYPEPTLTKLAMTSGAQARNNPGPKEHTSDFFQYLQDRNYDPAGSGSFDTAAAIRAIRGAIVGFAAPAIGAVALVLNRWMDDNELGRLADSVRSSGSADQMRAVLLEPVRQALYRTPVPTLLYRTAMPGATVMGTPVEPETLVIVGLGSVRADSSGRADPTAAWNWLFGGKREGENPHACPARYAALGVIMGIAAALLAKPGVERVRSLVVTYQTPRSTAG